MAMHPDKKSGRKTTELIQTPEGRPVIELQQSDQSERSTKSVLESLLDRTTRFIGNAAVILLLVLVVSKVAADMRKRPILIDHGSYRRPWKTRDIPACRRQPSG